MFPSLRFENQAMRLRLLIIVVGVVVTDTTRADRFELFSGGSVEGRLLNPDESPREQYLIETPQGIQLALAADQVRQHKPLQPEQAAYRQRSVQTADTPEGHWELAEWCQEQGLLSEKRSHLRRLVELDPDHAEARRVLGYQRVGERWMTRDELMAARGYVLYEGDWRTPQDVEVRRRESARRQQEIDHKSNLKRWRAALTSRNADRAREAAQQILDLSHPLAAPALIEALDKEENYQVRLLLLKALGGIRGSAAVGGLVERAVLDADAEMREVAIEMLAPYRDDPYVAGQLVKALKSNANDEVNRAAYALGKLANQETVLPLIEALVTRHKVRSQGPPGEVNAGFSKTQGGGFSFGKGGPREVVVPVKNPDVLSALSAITGQSFAFDQRAWKAWYTANRRIEKINLRRD